ncbi:MAG: iron ABC transporter permease [Aquabacterium sp.]
MRRGAGLHASAGQGAACRWALGLVLLAALLMALGMSVGSTGWSPWWSAGTSEADAVARQIVWEVRAPRCVGAWLAGCLLGLAGALSQGLFRNPLADPYLLGSSSGAALGVAGFLLLLGAAPASSEWWVRLGLTGSAFAGSVAAVLLTLTLAKGVEHTLRLLLAGVIVGVVLGAVSALLMLMSPDIMRAMQAFMLGTTGFLGWRSVVVLAPVLLLTGAVAWSCSRALDALSLGDAAAISLGVRLPVIRVLLVAALALATGTAVAQAGLISFVGLVAPHLVRAGVRTVHGPLLILSALMGGALLLAADILARWVIAPQEWPVGVLTAILGGSYLLWRMHRAGARA